MERKTINLPLHGGKCPKWLYGKMKKLAKPITATIIEEKGQEEFLRKLSDPTWFQSLSCALGYDWHSSGVTTVTTAALRESLNEQNKGIAVCGGKGKTSRKTPQQIIEKAKKLEVKPSKAEELKLKSRLSAKIDSNCLQDQHTLYHHTFFFTEKGEWTVIQQGMKEQDKKGYARRYHWYSPENTIEEPHEGISTQEKTKTLDLTSKKSKKTRKISVDLVKDGEQIEKYFRPKGQKTLNKEQPPNLIEQTKKEKTLSPRHEVKMSPQIKKALNKAEEIQPKDYKELVQIEGIGKKTLRALALISDLIYNEKPSFEDPATYSFAHGGKDGYPYPVNKKRYNETTKTLEKTIEQSEINKKEKRKALKKLSKNLKQ